MPTRQLDNFDYSNNRLDALYMQLFEEETSYTPAINDLFKELIIMQLVASVEAYELETTYELLKNNLNRIASTDKVRREIINILVSPHTSWTDMMDTILQEGTKSLTSPSFDSWISWLAKNYTPGLSVQKSDNLFLTEVLATRNLFAHHRGIVNIKYINRTGDYYKFSGKVPPAIGSLRAVAPDYCLQAIRCFSRIVREIDSHLDALID